MLRVNIVSTDNGAGLSKDARLLVQVLQNTAGVRVGWSKSFHPRGVRRMVSNVPSLRRPWSPTLSGS
jgi:hypothetical protein